MRKMLPQWEAEKQIRDVSQLVNCNCPRFESVSFVMHAATKAKDAWMEEERYSIWYVSSLHAHMLLHDQK